MFYYISVAMLYIYTTIKTQLTVVLLLVLRFILLLLLLLPSMQRYTILISHLSEILVID